MSIEQGLFRKVRDFDPLRAARFAGPSVVGSGIASEDFRITAIGVGVWLSTSLISQMDKKLGRGDDRASNKNNLKK